MSKKHYISIAAMIRRNIARCQGDNPATRLSQAEWRLMASELAKLFAEDNPRFDSARFLGACVPTPND